MRQHWTIRAGAIVTAVLLGTVLSACSTVEKHPDSTASRGSEPQASSHVPPAQAEALLSQYGLDGMGTAQIIDHLDRLSDQERPADLMASVRPRQLVIASADEESTLAVPDDRFYLSVAPFVDQTHECFYHSLTTCRGELSSESVQVKIVDETNDKVLVEESRTTFDNGFLGFWLPRNIEGKLQVTVDGRAGEVAFATNDEAPTCLTTLRLT